MTYSNPDVALYITQHFVPYEAGMERRECIQLFRNNRVIWTPSAGFADRNGSVHYSSPGFLPPSDYLSVLRIGRARCLMAWTRASEAITELEEASQVENAMTPEVLFWLSVALFLERKDTKRMYEVWEELTARYPSSPWAHRTYSPPAY